MSFISERLVQSLRLQRYAATVPLIGIGQSDSGATKGVVSVKLQSLFDDSKVVQLQAYVLPRLTTRLPSFSCPRISWNELDELQLADKDFLKRGYVDIILGADGYGQIIEPQLIKEGRSHLIAQKSALGWIVSGPIDCETCRSGISFSISKGTLNQQLYELLKRFWVQEELPATSNSDLNSEEAECEQHFVATHSRDSTGRYIVRLPLKLKASSLGDTKLKALRQLQRISRKLASDQPYCQLYHQFLKEYETLNHMRKAPLTPEPTLVFYLPHHGVLKEERITTKLRVVFNGSSQSSTGLALNDVLHSGAKLQVDNPDVLIWLRTHRFVFGTDIVKMFRQIKVHHDDWDLQRILWYDDDQNIIPYQLTTVTYGLNCAPWLSLRVLQQLVEDEGHRFPLAKASLSKGRYVDDIYGGADSEDELKDTIKDVMGLCMAGGFPLQKWSSNSLRVLKDLGLSNDSASSVSFAEETVRVLGLSWNPSQDQFRFRSKVFNSTQITKRSVLSEIAQIYDPLGFVAPVVVRAKMLIQELWQIKVGWDDSLPQAYLDRWRDFRQELAQLDILIIPRWLRLTSRNCKVQLHGFSDASTLAMGAVVYLRVESPGCETSISLVCAKTKVAPLKRMTIPRLELSAALLLSELMVYVQRMLEVESLQLYLWTDSAVGLAWISGHPSRWKEFVRNRVSRIQEILPRATWFHVAGKDNPADCASRGVSPAQLVTHPLWWHGPQWLSLSPVHWPHSRIDSPPEVAQEELPVPVFTVVAAQDRRCKPEASWDIIRRYNTLSRLLQATASAMRAARRFRHKEVPSSRALEPRELEEVRTLWLRSTQGAYFSSEIKVLSSGESLPSSHPLSRLTPFLDDQGILRLGGRLKNAELNSEEKQPAIIPRISKFTSLVIDDAHQRTLHGGTQLTLAYLRQRYWVLGGRVPVRSHILRCVRCARFRGTRATQLMAQLPASRIQSSRPFLHTGVDYAGPFTIQTWRGRAARSYKGYIAVFVCFATSAVHLEVVTDYSSDAFVAAYKRFSGRRGICATLRSDQGTTLIGADRQLRELFDQASKEATHIAASLASQGTKWIFNPPAAPHFGGKWEAAVKSVKFHLKRIIGDSVLTYEEFTTLLVQIEAILNSRPLCPLSEDPEDCSALTPGHFLTGDALTAVPEPSLLSLKESRLSRWQLISSRTQLFWDRWFKECLHRYQAISKWKHPSTELKVGSLVLLTDERFPPSKWPLARVTALHPGADGLVRVVEIKVGSTCLTRPISKLCVLPVSSTVDSPASGSSPGVDEGGRNVSASDE